MLAPMLLLAIQSATPPPAPAPGSTHPPDVEARLSSLVGDWTVPGQPGFRETCAWFGKRAFVVCNSSDSADGSAGQSTLGWSKARGRFTYQTYSTSGNGRYEWGYPHGEKGIVYADERPVSTGMARVQVWLEPQPDGRLRFRQERSLNGGPWEKTADFFYVPRK